MKVLCILSLLMPFTLNAQKFVATPNGLRDVDNIERNFLVLNFPDKTTKELYDATNKFIQMSYIHPDNVMRGNVEGEYLRTSTFSKDAFLLQKGLFGEPYYADMRFNTSFEFREGRIKLEIESIDFYYAETKFEYIRLVRLSYGIFDTKGNPIKDYNIKLENYFNKYVSDLMLFINKEFTPNDEDW